MENSKEMTLPELHTAVVKREAKGKILFQPRIGCWFGDKKFAGQKLPGIFEHMTLPQIYRELGCSARIYEYRDCFERVKDPRVVLTHNELSNNEVEHVYETPVGKITAIDKRTPNSPRAIKKKWWLSTEEDLKVYTWMEERVTWRWNQEKFLRIQSEWGDLGAPTMFMPRINIQHLYIDVMGVEDTTYALYDFPEAVEAFFEAQSDSHKRLIELINQSPIDIINFGDNLHVGTLTPSLFKKYVLPEYIKRNELLHKAGKFTSSHWDGDTKGLLPFARECGLDGIEAITPKPQGDVTIKEIKDALGDEVFLLDGIAAVLFDTIFPVQELIDQVHELIDLFGSKIIMGISDELSSTGDIERIRIVKDIVDQYNASV